MVRAVLDTNVVVSALRSRRGPAFRLLSLVGSGRFEISLSVALALEYEEVARRATPVSGDELDTILAYLCAEAHKQRIFVLWRPSTPDPGDEMVLDLAVASRASHLVTFNVRHFASASRFGIRVARPHEFLAEIGD
jgi:putative PIN family toxin of toxin-antitoxin system